MAITVGKVQQDGGEYEHLALHADAMLALAARKGIEIQVVELGGERIRCTLSGLAAKVDRASFSFDGTKALAWLADGTLHVWDVTTGNALAVIPHADGPIAAAAFHADDTKVVVVYENGTGRVCSTAGSELATFDVSGVLSVAKERAVRVAMPDDRRLFVGVSSDKLRLPGVAVLDLQTGHIDHMDVSFLKGKPIGSHQATYASAFSRDCSRMLCEDGGLFPGHGWWSEYELVDMTGPRHLVRKGTGGAALKFAEFSPDGCLFAICYFPNSGATARACIADAMTGDTRQDFETSLPFVRGVGIASGGGHVAVAHITKSVMLTYTVLG